MFLPLILFQNHRFSFFHSFGHFYSAPSSPLLLRGAPDYSTDTVSEFQGTVGKGLAQGPYMAARAGVEPTTLWLKAIDSTKAPPCPTTWWRLVIAQLHEVIAQFQHCYSTDTAPLYSSSTSPI